MKTCAGAVPPMVTRTVLLIVTLWPAMYLVELPARLVSAVKTTWRFEPVA